MTASSPFSAAPPPPLTGASTTWMSVGPQLLGQFDGGLGLIVEWIAMTVPGLACAASSPTTSRTCSSLSTVTLMTSASATSATLSASVAPSLGQRRHRLGADVENDQTTRPFDEPLGHRRAHVAQSDVAELHLVTHERKICPPSTLKIWPVIHLA